MKEQPAILGNIGGLVLKVLPQAAAMKMVLNNVSNAASQSVHQPTHIEEDADALYFIAEECPCRWRSHRDKPACQVTVGVLTEAMSFATGEQIRVEEIECIAAGETVGNYRIDKKALE